MWNYESMASMVAILVEMCDDDCEIELAIKTAHSKVVLWINDYIIFSKHKRNKRKRIAHPTYNKNVINITLVGAYICTFEHLIERFLFGKHNFIGHSHDASYIVWLKNVKTRMEGGGNSVEKLITLKWFMKRQTQNENDHRKRENSINKSI